MRRRAFLTTLAAGVAGCSAVSPDRVLHGRTTGDPIQLGATVRLAPVVRGEFPDADHSLTQPTDLAVLSAGEWLIADRVGRVYRYDGTLHAEPVLDVADRVVTRVEQGLLGLALHPTDDRRLFLRYSSPPREGTPEGFTHTAVLSAVRLTADRRGVVPGSERVLLEVPQPGPEHNGGSIAFGPDGLLYVSLGSGEWLRYPRDDLPPGHAQDWYDWNLGNNGQDVTENLLGSILRIDVDEGGSPDRSAGSGGGGDGSRPYGIPDDNPLVGRPGLDEHYAWGFRNPWRMGFSGDRLIVGDVGEYAFEEVDVVVKGGNYGWNVREGHSCFNARNPDLPGPWCPTETPGGRPLREPVVSYTHRVATDAGTETRHQAVIGGYVYDGGRVPAVDGEYVFGDLNRWLFAATPGDDEWPMRRLRVENTGDGRPPGLVYGFARDAAGELLALLAGGPYQVARIAPAEGSA